MLEHYYLPKTSVKYTILANKLECLLQDFVLQAVSIVENLLSTAILGQMHAIRLELRVWEGREDEHIRNAALVVDVVESDHDGVVPPDKPEWDATKHGWQQEYLVN